MDALENNYSNYAAFGRHIEDGLSNKNQHLVFVPGNFPYRNDIAEFLSDFTRYVNVYINNSI